MALLRAAGAVALLVSSAVVWGKDAPPPQPASEPNWAEVRTASEAALRANLVDPASAQVEWTGGFRWASYKPFLRRRVYGWTGCGTVNARNRMGGYDGVRAFAIVYVDGVKFFDMDDDGSLGMVGGQCAQLALPTPQPAFVDAPRSAGTTSIADELAKLAALRDRGVLTPAEFDAAKARLLGRP